MTTDHKPENWFHEAGSDHCPHGAEPDRTSHDWNTWAEHHTGSPQDISICLEAPIGPCCPVCSEEFDEPVSWEHCTQRTTAAVTPAVTEDSHEQKVAEYLSTPYTDDTPSPTAVPVCICGHPEQRHLEDACQACGCGDYLEPQDAAEVIDRWRQEALKKRDDRRAAVLREAADYADTLRQFDRASGTRKAAQISENVGILRVADALRHMADEVQQAAPAVTDDQRTTADLLAASATEYRVPVPENGGTNLIARRQGAAFGTGWSVVVPGWGGGRAWTTEGWQESISALSVDRLFCWPDAATAVAEARRALAAEETTR